MKTSATFMPATFSTSVSVSRNVVPNRLASNRPTVLLPAPDGPTRTTRGAITVPVSSLHDQRFEVAAHISANLIDRVAAELLQHGVGNHECHHRLGNNTCRGNSADIAALVDRLRSLAGRDVDRVESARNGRDRLHRRAYPQRFTRRHAAFGATGAIGATTHTVGGVLDLVMSKRPAPPR